VLTGFCELKQIKKLVDTGYVSTSFFFNLKENGIFL
jgi:hypothetical protein